MLSLTSYRRNQSCAAVLLGVCLLFLLKRRHFLHASSSPPFSLLVTLQFTEDKYKHEFLQEFESLADYVRQHEPQTLTYDALESDQNPLQILILERYRDKDVAYLQVHKSSQAFLTFRPKLKSMEDAGHVTINGHSYVDTMIGFGQRLKQYSVPKNLTNNSSHHPSRGLESAYADALRRRVLLLHIHH